MRKSILLTILLAVLQFNAFSKSHGELEDAIISVANSVGKAVVSISSTVKVNISTPRFYFGSPFEEFDSPFRKFFEEFFGELPEKEFKRIGLGSGVIIDKEGYILTNEHVISGATQIKVKLSDGREYDATVKGTDPTVDLAVIKIDAHNLPVAKLGDSDNLAIGQWVVAIGNPFGFAISNPEPTVTVGVISALGRYLPAIGSRNRSYDDLIQTDAAINPGNSGGPLVNLDGEIIGINTAIITTSGGYEGLGFAIPINKAKRILNKLIKGEKVLYGWLGIRIQDLNEDLKNYFGIKEKTGVLIVKVYSNSPAEKANLKEGDLILAFNNIPINTTLELMRLASSSEVGKIVTLKVLREGKEFDVDVKVGAKPQDIEALEEGLSYSDYSFRGITVDDITESNRRRYNIKENEGVVITNIESNSIGEKSGLVVGDVIIKIEGKIIKNKEDFINITSKIKGDCLIKTQRGFFVLREK